MLYPSEKNGKITGSRLAYRYPLRNDFGDPYQKGLSIGWGGVWILIGMAHCCFRIFFLTLSYVTFVLKVNCFFFFLTYSNIKVKLLMCTVVFCLVRQISCWCSASRKKCPSPSLPCRGSLVRYRGLRCDVLRLFHFNSYLIILEVVRLYRMLKPRESVFDERGNWSTRRKFSKSC